MRLSLLMDLSPRGIREKLGLSAPIYAATAAYGHFGRQAGEAGPGTFSWEGLGLVDDLKARSRQWLKTSVLIRIGYCSTVGGAGASCAPRPHSILKKVSPPTPLMTANLRAGDVISPQTMFDHDPEDVFRDRFRWW